MKSIDWNEVRGIALDCLSSSLELLTWARRSQEEDYDVGSATLHLATIDKARNNAENFLGILTIGIDGSSKNHLCQFPIYDQLAHASAGETAHPDFGVAATAHEAVFRLLMIALLHIENNLKGGLTLEDLHGVSPEELRVTLRALEKKDSMEHVLGSVGYLHNLQAWIHREWAAVSQLPLAGNCRDVEQPQEPISPKELLANWREIVIALGMRNNEEDKRKVERLNETYNGPIMKPGQGKQPIVDKVKLLEWWNNLEKLVESQMEQARDARLTVQDTHPYGREGEVVPEISGQVKKRRRDRQP